MGKPYTRWEDQIIIEGRKANKEYKEIAERLPHRQTSSVKDRARKLGLTQPRSRGGARPQGQKKDEGHAARKCLCCGRMFNSEWIGNRICKSCSNTVAISSGAMI